MLEVGGEAGSELALSHISKAATRLMHATVQTTVSHLQAAAGMDPTWCWRREGRQGVSWR